MSERYQLDFRGGKVHDHERIVVLHFQWKSVIAVFGRNNLQVESFFQDARVLENLKKLTPSGLLRCMAGKFNTS